MIVLFKESLNFSVIIDLEFLKRFTIVIQI
jgi:hypothetical protein